MSKERIDDVRKRIGDDREKRTVHLQRVLAAFCEDAAREGYGLPLLIYALQTEAALLQRIINERPEIGPYSDIAMAVERLHRDTRLSAALRRAGDNT